MGEDCLEGLALGNVADVTDESPDRRPVSQVGHERLNMAIHAAIHLHLILEEHRVGGFPARVKKPSRHPVAVIVVHEIGGSLAEKFTRLVSQQSMH